MKVPVVEGMSSGRHILLSLQYLIASFFPSYLTVACMNMNHYDLQLFHVGGISFSITRIIYNFNQIL